MTPRSSNDSPAESTLHANTSVGSDVGRNTSTKSNLFDGSSGSVNTFGGIETENQGMFM